MKLLEERIIRDGKVLSDDILKVDSFLNQQIDTYLIDEMGREFCRLFSDCGITKVLTIEASGIAVAAFTAWHFGVPMVIAKKTVSSNMSGDMYSTHVHSFTKNRDYDAVVTKDYLCANDRLLIIDDFLASGSALKGLISLAELAGAKVCGAGIVIEKVYQGGGNLLRNIGIRVESLAKIESMSVKDGIVFSD